MNWQTELPSPLLVAFGAAAALHAAVLVGAAASSAPSGEPGAPPVAVQVRQLTAAAEITPPLPMAAPSAEPERAAPVAARQQIAEPRAALAHVPERMEPATPPERAQPRVAPETIAADASTAASSSGAQPPSHEAAPFDYVPRRYLSVVPRPVAPVVLAYPEGDALPEPLNFVLALYIDEAGVVRRAVVDQGTPPERFEAAAIAAFSGVRFEPGQLNGHTVRSLIRVEVGFSTQPP